MKASNKIDEVNEEAQHSAQAVENLSQSTKQAENIVDIIQNIASTTNLLSLNAGIQAVQAGQYGKGFAVIAGETRKLSQQTEAATKDVTSNLQAVRSSADGTIENIQTLAVKINEVSDISRQISAVFDTIQSNIGSSVEHTNQMADMLEKHIETSDEVSVNILSVKDSLQELANQSAAASHQLLKLTRQTETIHATLFENGLADNHHQEILNLATNVAKAIAARFEQAIDNNEISNNDLFDINYQVLANINPPKYHTRYDAFADKVLPEIQEPAIGKVEGVVFVIATDVNGYVPTHNNAFSKELTGIQEYDQANNRTKRIFADSVGRRCGSHQQAFLLQTYKRDTGETMHDLSVPIFVKGKHWGGLRIGYLSHQDQAEPTEAT